MKKTKGFTLIEVVISILIISIISIATFKFFQYYQRFTIDAELRLMAVNGAREVMEKLYWTSPPVGGPVDVPLDSTAFPPQYDRSRDYTVSYDSTGRYKIIAVTVRWDY